MRRHLGTGLCIATLLALTACSGDDESSSDSTTDGTTQTGGTGVDGSDVSVAGTGVDGSTVGGSGGTVTTVAGTGTTVAGSGTTIAGSTVTTVAGSTGTTVAGSTGTTVAGTATTAPPAAATTEAPTTTNAVPQTVAELVLRSDGLGPLRFGADSNVVVSTISSILGAPTSDAAAEYPTPADGGSFISADEELGFVQPFGRTVCWMNGLCTESGGNTAGPYAFVGWYYAAADADELSTVDGLDVGSRWSDFTTVMTAEPGGCYSVGYGTSAGISLTLQSEGTPFSVIEDDGSETAALPDPADVTVVQMQAGQQVAFLLSDC
jgi:hypothetical protein